LTAADKDASCFGVGVWQFRLLSDLLEEVGEHLPKPQCGAALDTCDEYTQGHEGTTKENLYRSDASPLQQDLYKNERPAVPAVEIASALV
jgi:hypothetical protein